MSKFIVSLRLTGDPTVLSLPVGSEILSAGFVLYEFTPLPCINVLMDNDEEKPREDRVFVVIESTYNPKKAKDVDFTGLKFIGSTPVGAGINCHVFEKVQ